MSFSLVTARNKQSWHNTKVIILDSLVFERKHLVVQGLCDPSCMFAAETQAKKKKKKHNKSLCCMKFRQQEIQPSQSYRDCDTDDVDQYFTSE